MIGSSTGCFGFSGLSLNEKIKRIKLLKNKFIEILFFDADDFINFNLFEYDLSCFDKINIHLPFNKISYYNGGNAKLILKKMRELVGVIKVNYFIVHPCNVYDFSFFNEFDNVIFENSGNPNKFGSKIDDIEYLIENTNNGFCIDLAHVKSSGIDFDNLIRLVGNRLRLVHVSEYVNSDENHSSDISVDTLGRIIKLNELGIDMIFEGRFLC